MSGEIEQPGGALPPAYRQGEYGIEPIPERFQRDHRDGPGYSTARQPGELDPEWVMVGVDVPAGKRLYASKDLKGSAFQLAIDQAGNGDGWHLTSTMQKMLVITKPTYGECLAELMRIWQNWGSEERALPPGFGPGGGEYGNEAHLAVTPGEVSRRTVSR